MTSSTSTDASLPRIACDKKTFAPTIAFCEKGSEIHIRRWNGSRWVNIDGSETETAFSMLENSLTTEEKKSGAELLGLDIASDDGIVTVLKYDHIGTVINFYDTKTLQNKELLLNLKESAWNTNGNRPLPINIMSSGFCVNQTPNPATGSELWLSIPGKGTGKIKFGCYRLQIEQVKIDPEKLEKSTERKVNVMVMGLAGCPKQEIRMFATTSSNQATVKLDETYGRLAPGWVMPAIITVTANQNLESSTDVEIEIKITGDGGKTLITEKTKVSFVFDVTNNATEELLPRYSEYYHLIELLPPESLTKSLEFSYIENNNLPINAKIMTKLPSGLNVAISPNPFTPPPSRRGRGNYLLNITGKYSMSIRFEATEKVKSGFYEIPIKLTRGIIEETIHYKIHILDFKVHAEMGSIYKPETTIKSSIKKEGLANFRSASS